MVKSLNEGHKNVKLDDESMDRLITWIDLNGPYYPTTCCAYPHDSPGRCPLEREEMETLGKLTGFSFGEVTMARKSKGPMISFDRPELSPCLALLSENSQEYREALTLIRNG